MRIPKGRPRMAACLVVLATVAAVAAPAVRNAGATAVREVFIEDFAPAYPDARRLALERALQQATGLPLRRAERMVAFVEVREETVRPTYYAIRVAVGLIGADWSIAEDVSGDSLPSVRAMRPDGGVAEPAGSKASAKLQISVKVQRGAPGAMRAYRALLDKLHVQHVTIHATPDLLLDVTVSLRDRPAALPLPPEDSGVVVSEVQDTGVPQ